jgi:hypothetical protein
MAGLGTLLILTWRWPTLLDVARRSVTSRPMLWVLMLAFPFPVHRDDRGLDDGGAGTPAVDRLRLMRTVDGASPRCTRDDAVHAAGVLRPLLRARSVVPVPDRPRDLARAGSGTGSDAVKHSSQPLTASDPNSPLPGGAPWLSSGTASPR